jgi:hypothetical protein
VVNGGTGRPPEIVVDRQPAVCRRCQHDGILSACVPHGWSDASGMRTQGIRRWVLCPRCDCDRPGAAGLITFFLVHGRVDDPSQVEEFSCLLREWITQLQALETDPDAFERDVEAWKRGDFD